MVSFSTLRPTTLTLLTSLLLSTQVLAVPSNYNHASRSLHARGNVNSFAGSSSYYIAGLSVEERQRYLDRLQQYGAKVLRIWVAQAGGTQKGSELEHEVPEFESQVGQYNPTALKMLDDVMVDCNKRGIKVVLALHNGNNFGNYDHCDAYCEKYGGANAGKNSDTAKNFYEQSGPDFDKRINAILSYNSPGFNKPWSQLSDVIMAIDIQNEPMVQAVEFAAENPNGAAGNWLCGRAKTIKSLVGTNIAVSTGGLAGSVWASDSSPYINWADYALQCPDIDIIAIHGYINGNGDQWNGILNKATSAANANNKLVMVEEWGVDPTNGDRDHFASQASTINNNGIPWLYWEFTPGPENDKDYELSIDGSQQNNIQAMIQQAASQQIAGGQEGFAKYLGGGKGTPSGPPTSTQSQTSQPTQTSPPSGTCQWEGHCLGATCQNENDCDGDLVCNNGTCGNP